MICAPYVGEEQAADFETVFSAVIYICFDAQLKKNWLWYMNLTTDSYAVFLVKTIEGYYIDMHKYLYSKETNWWWTKKRKRNLMMDNIKIYNKYI